MPSRTRNVALLYRIVVTAGEDPNVEALPFRAIFAAYDEVLAQEGLNPDHDQTYLRFLFRLGDSRRPGLSLYQSFEALLEELGIRIELNNQSIGSQEITRTFDEEDRYEDDDVDAPRIHAHHDLQGRSRRASFGTLQDVQDGNTRDLQYLSHSRASMSHLQVKERTIEVHRPSTRATTRSTEKTQVQPLYNYSKSAPSGGSRLTAQEFADSLQRQQGRHTLRQHHVLGPTTSKTNEDAPRRSSQRPDMLVNAGASANTDFPGGRESEGAQSQFAVDKRALFYQPSDTQLVRDIQTFQDYRIRQTARALFEKWCSLAFRASLQHRDMERQAQNHDVGALLRNGFDQWRAHSQRKRRALEIEQFFSLQERRASKGRDLYLLVKAFTHWAQCTSESKTQNDQARKNFLEVKYFHAWLKYTTVNSLKIRRQRLLKFLAIWRQRVAQASAYNVRAILFHNHRALRSVYWVWFWAFCDMRAPIWRDNRIRQKLFHRWESRKEKLIQWEQETLDERRYSIAKRHFSIWLLKIRSLLRDSQTARAFSRTKTTARAIMAWRRETRHAPIARQASNMVDWRVAGTVFATVVTQHRLQRQAELVCQLRVVRNSWTDWNDRLRQQTLTRRIDDRVVIETLYRWVIGERYILLARLHQQRIQQRSFSGLVQYWSIRKAHRHNAAQIVQTAANRRCLATIVKKWQSKKNLCDRNERHSLQFYAPRICQEILQAWTIKSRHWQELQTWAKDSEYFFLATKFIKQRWLNAMIDRKRQKRRDAYAQLRRTMKMNLARRVLNQWRLTTLNTVQLMEEARLREQDRLLQLGSRIFDHWRIQADSRVARHDQAARHYETNLTIQLLNRWVSRLEWQMKMEDKANLNDTMRIEAIALPWLQKLRLRLLKVTRGLEADALSLREFYEKRHLKNLLRRWHQKIAAGLHRPVRDSALSTRIRRPDFTVSTLLPSNREELEPEEWIPALRQESSYLRTPSKRAERVRALMEESTTPAGTPFQLRLLRPQALFSARRSGLGNSTTPRNVGFAAILETTPRTPRRGQERLG